ncbi:hypothetical protein [uncultured Holdemanella sp.]|uniref:hypothetical protein n=1 Tax=uncultured Holdemanella sp. TaxID=1763549 RepID=UPI0025F88B05|nr:hypothetical protein [uncultured Holdemanella sp.]
MRKKRLASNTISSLLLQITTIICGFVLPKLILSNFGSDVNGLVNSITQFLQIFAFLDLGVGAVFQSSLYKPLVDKDTIRLSEIYVSGQNFFSKLAKILLGYIVILIIVYPFLLNQKFDFIYISTLIIAMSVSSFAQYYFGMANGLFLTADQRGYVQYNIQIITLILNTLSCYILINLGASIHVIKLITSFIYLIRPIVLKIYVDKHYSLNKKIVCKNEPIKQKWNGLAQHVASVVLDSTDTIVLTVFSTLSDVSIYSVYNLVISGLKQLFNAMTNGVQALIGELYARQNIDELQKVFGWTEWLIHTMTTFIFGCAGVLIIPFVLIYTSGIADADYNQPIFSVILILAYAMYCLRLPYHIAIKAGVHYKETQHCYLIAALLNLFTSILLVAKLGLIGVAIGTLIAMTYQTIWMAIYDSKNIIYWPIEFFLKQLTVDILTSVIGVLFTANIKIIQYSYLKWFILAIRVSFIWGIIVVFVNSVFYRENLKKLLKEIKKIVGK